MTGGKGHILRVIAAILLAVLVLPVHSTAWARQKDQNRLTPRQLAAVVDARNFIEDGKPNRAVAILKSAANSSHPPLIVLNHLAWAQTETGDVEAAFATYHKAAELYPEDAPTARNLGLVLLRLNRLEEAADTLVRAYGLQSETEKEPALLALAASAHVQNESYALALPLLKQAGQDSGDMQVNWASLAVYCCIQLDRIEEALQYSRACTRLHPENAEAWSLLSRILIRKGDPLAAAAALETALAVRTGRAVEHQMDEATAMELASLYARGHANAEAAQRLAAGGAKDSIFRAAQYHYLAGQYEAALMILDSQPASPEPLMLTLNKTLLKGRILIELERTAEAVTALTRKTDVVPTPADRNKVNRLRATAYLLAGEALWLERSWAEAAANFDILATIPGYGNTGAALARAMRALTREAAVGVEISASN